jgi:hypothetical protein
MLKGNPQFTKNKISLMNQKMLIKRSQNIYKRENKSKGIKLLKNKSPNK